MEIRYTLQLISDWHVSNGLTGGSKTDNLFSKNNNQLPEIPGKTIKGLLRDALDEINKVQPDRCTKKEIDELFGIKDQEGTQRIDTAYFSNAKLVEDKDEIIINNLQSFLYRNMSSTAIDKHGLAVDKSLRSMEVCMPITLEGHISDVKEEQGELLKMAMQWTRQLGMKRNRGFGKCIFQIKNVNQ